MERFKIAQILKPQGIKGEVKLRVYTDAPERLASLSCVYLSNRDDAESRQVQSARMYKEFVYMKLSGCDDRNTAETLRGLSLYIDREEAAPLPDGAHYIVDLEGLLIRDSNGLDLGTLDEVIQTGGVDVYRVIGKRSFMFPAAKHVIVGTDIENGVITVDAEALGEVALYD